MPTRTYILQEMETFTNSDAIAIQAHRCDDERSATMLLHQIMGSAMANSEVDMCVCEIITPNGGLARIDAEVRPLPPEPDNDEEEE